MASLSTTRGTEHGKGAGEGAQLPCLSPPPAAPQRSLARAAPRRRDVLWGTGGGRAGEGQRSEERFD